MIDSGAIVIVCPTPTPYFGHQFERLAAEMRTITPCVWYTHARLTWNKSGDPPVGGGSTYSSQIMGGTVSGQWDRSFSAHRREWRIAGEMIRRLKQNRPRAVVVMGYRDLCRWRVMRWCRRNRVPVVAWADVNARGMRTFGRGMWLKRQYMRWIDRQVSAWMVCGRAGREYLDFFGIDSKRVFLSPVEPNYAQIGQTTDAAAAAVGATMGLSPQRKRFLCSGRLVPNKRFDRVIRAFLAIADQRPEWDLLVLGQGRLEAELRAMVPERLKERVIFGGFVDEPSRCWAVMRCCHVLVHLADHEPWGLIINEAVALGLAVVSSDVVGASLELVRDGVNGRLVPRDDDPATAAAAMLEVSAPDRLVAMSAAGADILAYWRHTADPIEGLKQALQFAGVAL